MKQAPRIIHNGFRPSYWKEMVADCCFNIRLGNEETSLLSYYCSCAPGFRPALKEIQRQTGIIPVHVSRARSHLCQRNVIIYSRGTITIDWYRIRNFAIMPRLQKEEALYGLYPRRSTKKLKELSESFRDEDAVRWNQIYRPKKKREFTPQEKTWIKKIENMTIDQYLLVLNKIKGFPQAPKNAISYYVMYTKNENLHRSKPIKTLFKEKGIALEDPSEFDWRERSEIEEALKNSSTIEEVRDFLMARDHTAFLLGSN